MFHYLLASSITIFGETAYAVRLVSGLLSIIAIPLMYRWGFILYRDKSNARWIALVGAAGLATFFWYVTISRTGYRANPLPLFIIFTSCFFWRGWQTGKIYYYLAARVGLDLSQYTYLSTQLLPLVFLLFISIQTVLNRSTHRTQLKTAWAGLLVMAVTSILISGPLLLFFVNNPNAFWGRVDDVAIKVDGSLESFELLGEHLWQAVRVFVDGEDPNWRHHLLGPDQLLIGSIQRALWPVFFLLSGIINVQSTSFCCCLLVLCGCRPLYPNRRCTRCAWNVIIPFYLYTRASMRYFLHNDFKEEVLLSDDALKTLRHQDSAFLIIPEYPSDVGHPPAFVWLVKDRNRPGLCFYSSTGYFSSPACPKIN